jgi:hypothetical protein
MKNLQIKEKVFERKFYVCHISFKISKRFLLKNLKQTFNLSAASKKLTNNISYNEDYVVSRPDLNSKSSIPHP